VSKYGLCVMCEYLYPLSIDFTSIRVCLSVCLSVIIEPTVELDVSYARLGIFQANQSTHVIRDQNVETLTSQAITTYSFVFTCCGVSDVGRERGKEGKKHLKSGRTKTPRQASRGQCQPLFRDIFVSIDLVQQSSLEA